MNSLFRFAPPAFLAAATFLSGGAEAALTVYDSRASFEAQGTIAENYGFEDWPAGFSSPGTPYTAHGVTYVSTDNLIVGLGTQYGNSSNVIINNFGSPISGTLLSSYDMLGFDLGSLGVTNSIDFIITTNVLAYSFLGVPVPNVNTGMTFFGFIADGGETILEMTFSSSPPGVGSFPALDNVTLGSTALIPEPETYALLLAGLGLLGVAARRRRRKQAAA